MDYLEKEKEWKLEKKENIEKEDKGEEEKEDEEKKKEEEEINNFFQLDFWRLWPDYDDPHTTFPGPVIEAGFYINMDLKLLIIYDNKKNKEILRKNFSIKLD